MVLTDNSKSALISQLKSEIQSHADLTTMNDEQVQALAAKVLDDKLEWARVNNPEAYVELSSLNFKEKKNRCFHT